MSWPIRILGESGEEKLSCVDSKNIPLNYIIFFLKSKSESGGNFFRKQLKKKESSERTCQREITYIFVYRLTAKIIIKKKLNTSRKISCNSWSGEGGHLRKEKGGGEERGKYISDDSG